MKKPADVCNADLGITISCYRGDLPLLKGCLASIRAHLPQDLPICLIPHGSWPLDDLREAYGLTVLDISTVDPRLCANSYGYGWTKMIAFWHSPFERFLHIDSDAVCWGNFLNGIPWREYDLIYNEPHEVVTEFIQKSQYFDPEQVFHAFPFFDWKGQPYFNTGIFIARRGIFPLDEYLDLLAFQKKNPSAFLCGDQGILNFMAFKKIATGTLKARAWPLQAVVPVIHRQELKSRFTFMNGIPVIKEADSRLIHWAGAKPNLVKRESFSKPMVYYRLKHLQKTKSLRRYLGRCGLMWEDLTTRITKNHEGSYLRAFQTKVKWIIKKYIC
jgi:hypothetical protein